MRLYKSSVAGKTLPTHRWVSTNPSPQSPVAEQVTASIVVRRALAELPEDFKEALVLREYAGMDYQEIAQHQQVGGANRQKPP